MLGEAWRDGWENKEYPFQDPEVSRTRYTNVFVASQEALTTSIESAAVDGIHMEAFAPILVDEEGVEFLGTGIGGMARGKKYVAKSLKLGVVVLNQDNEFLLEQTKSVRDFIGAFHNLHSLDLDWNLDVYTGAALDAPREIHELFDVHLPHLRSLRIGRLKVPDQLLLYLYASIQKLSSNCLSSNASWIMKTLTLVMVVNKMGTQKT